LLAAGSDSTLITSSESLDIATGGVHGGDTAFYGVYGDRVEYIYFPLGQIPPAGPYQVGVNGFDASLWTVTVEWYGAELTTVVKEEASSQFEVTIPLLEVTTPMDTTSSTPSDIPSLAPSTSPSSVPFLDSLSPCDVDADCAEGAICGDDGNCIFALRFILSWTGTGMFFC
jgi:hypothetical protein